MIEFTHQKRADFTPPGIGVHMKKGFGCLTSLVLLIVLTACLTNLPLRITGIAQRIAPWHWQSTGSTGNPSDVLLVNNTHRLPDGYVPGKLVNLYAQKRYFRLAASDIYLEQAAFEAANRMFEQAEREGINGFILTSGYRSAEKQAAVYAEQQDGTASKPGYSEHQTGLAFDVTALRDGGGFEETPQFAWLMEHCWDYGFILRYPAGKENITGIPYEPWHYRYLGEELAKEVHDSGLTLEGYIKSITRK